jgi:hypothetical protein
LARPGEGVQSLGSHAQRFQLQVEHFTFQKLICVPFGDLPHLSDEFGREVRIGLEGGFRAP